MLHSKQWRLHSFVVQSCPALRFRFVILSSRIAVDLKIESPSNSMHLNGVGKGHKLNEFKSKSHSQKVISNSHQNHHHVRVTSVGRCALHRQRSPAVIGVSRKSRVNFVLSDPCVAWSSFRASPSLSIVRLATRSGDRRRAAWAGACSGSRRMWPNTAMRRLRMREMMLSSLVWSNTVVLVTKWYHRTLSIRRWQDV